MWKRYIDSTTCFTKVDLVDLILRTLNLGVQQLKIKISVYFTENVNFTENSEMR